MSNHADEGTIGWLLPIALLIAALVLAAVAFTCGCEAEGSYDYPRADPGPSAPEPMRCLMWTDLACIPNCCEARRAELQEIFKAYDTIFVVADIVRPYTFAGRTQTAVTDGFVANLRGLRAMGFRVMVTLFNEPSVRNGQSALLASEGATGYKPMTVSDLYSEDMLWQEIGCWQGLLDQFTPDYIMLCLEPSDPASVEWQARLAKAVRAMTDRPIFTCGLGAGRWAGDPIDGIYPPEVLHNGDGNESLADCDTLRQWTAEPAVFGWIAWFRGLVSTYGGEPGVLEPYMTECVAQ